MNYLKIIMAVSLLVLMGCKEDEPDTPACTQSTWLGTYTGTIDCDGYTEDVTVTLTASGDTDVIIVYETSALEATYDPLTVSGCSLEATSSDVGLTLTLSASVSDDSFTMTEVISDGTSESTCVINASK